MLPFVSFSGYFLLLGIICSLFGVDWSSSGEKGEGEYSSSPSSLAKHYFVSLKHTCLEATASCLSGTIKWSAILVSPVTADGDIH